MKIISFRYISVLMILLVGVTSCELTKELDEYEPLYSLVAETAIDNEDAANLALQGAYAAFKKRDQDGTPYIFVLPELMGAYVAPGSFLTYFPRILNIASNNPVTDSDPFVNGMYSGMYKLINNTNWIIQEVDLLDEEKFTNPDRKTEILGEAKTLRALAHFYLLRLYGQFYDIDSEYGLDVRLSPAMDASAYPRKTVRETYTEILKDLDFGITNNPDLTERYFVNKTFARGLKARVLLYMGDYANAATEAKNVIDNAGGDFALASDFAGQFQPHSSPAVWDNSEVLFGTSGTEGADNEDVGMGSLYGGFIAGGITQNYMDMAAGTIDVNTTPVVTINYDGNRATTMATSNTGAAPYSVNKYIVARIGEYEMVYHMRFAEMYLILAEASARAASAVTTEALDAINTLRVARGAAEQDGINPVGGFAEYPAEISYDQFLEAVRVEKAIELVAETGESWFDLIRYDYADGFGSGFQVSDHKPTATNSDKFILPIPQASIDAAGGVVKQNPTYE